MEPLQKCRSELGDNGSVEERDLQRHNRIDVGGRHRPH